MKKISNIALTIILASYAIATKAALEGASAAEQVGQSFFKDKTKLKNPFSLRDPFKAPLKTRSAKEQKKLFQEGVFSNVPSIENVPLKNIKITGVFIGNERRAIARLSGQSPDKNDTVILKEGMKLGQDGAELKAILPGGIVLVEKIINVYGQEEYLETVIPISSE